MAQSPEPRALSSSCRRWLTGHPPQSAEASLAELARWAGQSGAPQDVYGDGRMIRELEEQVARLLGCEAAVFMPSGTMAQQLVARIWCDRARNPLLAMHPTCHMELHEQRGYARLHGLQGLMAGERGKVLTAEHLAALPETPAALVVELPMREIGGLLPTWEQLEALKAAAHARGVKLMLDGARLWETTPYYGRSLAEIARGFDSVYVSFYKTLGGLSGAILAAPADVVAEAKVWQRRHGGNLYTLLPYVASARLVLEKRLPRIPEYVAEARRVADALRAVEGLALVPEVPPTNMMHVHVNRDAASLNAAKERIAREHGDWMFGRAAPGAHPGASYVELSIGEGASAFTSVEITERWRQLVSTPRAP